MPEMMRRSVSLLENIPIDLKRRPKALAPFTGHVSPRSSLERKFRTLAFLSIREAKTDTVKKHLFSFPFFLISAYRVKNLDSDVGTEGGNKHAGRAE